MTTPVNIVHGAQQSNVTIFGCIATYSNANPDAYLGTSIEKRIMSGAMHCVLNCLIQKQLQERNKQLEGEADKLKQEKVCFNLVNIGNFNQINILSRVQQ